MFCKRQLQALLKEQEAEYDKCVQRTNADRAKYEDLLLKSESLWCDFGDLVDERGEMSSRYNVYRVHRQGG